MPRLERRFYQAFAAVHWIMTVQPPVPGWLDHRFHQDFRELLMHACIREHLFCPVYCLMPNHLHLMWMGLALQSDQLNAMKFLRAFLNRMLRSESLVRKESALDLGLHSAVDLGLHSAVDLGLHSAVDLRPQLRGVWKLQSQAFDHVLREEERKQEAFASVCFYIMANPMRANLVSREQDWPFSGAMIPGYPDLRPMKEDFWPKFWEIYCEQREPTPLAEIRS